MAHTFVIFGASGDLTSRKLIPAIYQLFRKGRLPTDTHVVGFARTVFSHDQWRSELLRSVREFSDGEFDDESWGKFAQTIYYHAGDLAKIDDLLSLKKLLDELDAGSSCARVYYLATAPQFYGIAAANLGAAGLASEECNSRRLVIEKPFGTDLATARALNTEIHKVFSEDQVFRIDHYLGKETVQNVMVLRFANSIFEPVWNRNYVEHVEITVAEEVAVGKRGSYYDTAGVLRDMFQNHLLQLLMITAMETPVRFNAKEVRDEKVKVLQAIRPLTAEAVAQDTLRGQYRGYRSEPGVKPDSQTATFAAIKLWVDNWRWQGVPFYLRSGKLMSCRTTQIVVQFREPPHTLFNSGKSQSIEGNRLVFQVQPAEGIQLHVNTKVPDHGMQLRMTDLDFRFRQEFNNVLPEAYQRLLLDAMQGDASLFARSDEVELAWSIIDPIQSTWDTQQQPPLQEYEPNLWGPESAMAWMDSQGRQWFDSCPVIGPK